jgi:hypothetical protein
MIYGRGIVRASRSRFYRHLQIWARERTVHYAFRFHGERPLRGLSPLGMPISNSNFTSQCGVCHGTSAARYGPPGEERSVRGESVGYELCEKPHALRLACLPLREKPDRRG